MSSREELNSYIGRLHSRLRFGVTLRGVMMLGLTALLSTIGLVLFLRHDAFAARGLTGSRLALLLALGVTAVFGLLQPLRRLTRSRSVATLEATHPELEQRLTTFHEREQKADSAASKSGTDPFLELLAADTLQQTRSAAPPVLASERWFLWCGGIGLVCLAGLIWLIVSGPGSLGYGASLLWRGTRAHTAPLYSLSVTPGNTAVRRHADQIVTAKVNGLHPETVQLFARYGASDAWEPVGMQADPMHEATYHFVFAALHDKVDYYVTAGPLVSPQFHLRVVDLPSVKAIQVTYHYPKWTGMKPVTEEHTGDLRALEGTDAGIEIETDRPLQQGQLIVDGSHPVALSGGEGNHYRGVIRMEKDGAYHLAAADGGEAVRLTEDYFIATEKPAAPEISLDKPGREYRASPIEEVKVGVRGSAQFGLHAMQLHYSVNGGPEHEIGLLKAPGAKEAAGSQVLRLEDFKLVPGDLVSLYATAKDGHAEARTDISFIQAEPFEREFSQSQQSGGGGGGGGGGANDQTQMSKRQKELIEQTWRQGNSQGGKSQDAASAGQFLSEAQVKLRGQVTSLSARMQSRDLPEANAEFTGFEKDMQAASAAMEPSAEKLKRMQWKDALPYEQKALQALLRAEATFRQIQVAFGQQQGGGAGGGGGAGRDLASLFDLELDTAKNQYETAHSASPEEQHEKAVEDALAKLDALSKQQDELAHARPDPQESFQQRWQQEMLRRQAEELQRQMEQLSRSGEGQKGSQSGSNGQAASGGSSGEAGESKSGSSGSQQARGSSAGQPQGAGSKASGKGETAAGGKDPRIEQALNRLRQAGDAMRRSGESQSGGVAAQRAADQLHEASRLLGGSQKDLASGRLEGLSSEADRLAQQERAQADQINQVAASQSRSGGLPDREAAMARMRERSRLAESRQELSTNLSGLQRSMRDTARAIAPKQPGAAQALREALSEMDQSDLDNHVQRTADWLRRGINPNSNGTEAEIAHGLSKLGEQLHQAERAMGDGKAASRSGAPGDQMAALDQVQRLRSQVEAMSALSRGGQPGDASDRQRGNSPGHSGPASGQTKPAAASNDAGVRGAGSQGASGGMSPGGDSSPGGGSQAAGNQPGGRGSQGGRSGDVRAGGGGAEGTAWGNVNTGNNRYGAPGRPGAPGGGSNETADAERTYQQGLRELNQLRQMIAGDAQASKEAQQLARQMQQLDPSRFPGNPELAEQMHRDILSSMDRLELQLQRAGGASSARTGQSAAIPAGYQESVADYYRRLSARP